MKTSGTLGIVSARGILTGLTLALTAGLAASPASAGLGSFAPSDGYNIFVPSGTYNWSDVSYYNSGAYGPNSGGGSGPTLTLPDAGLWSVTGQVGGYFTSSAARAVGTAGAPAYTSTPPGAVPVYLVGDHGPGRTDNSSLAFRNDTVLGSTGAAVYDYSLDIYDTGGPVPSSVTSGPVSFDLYFATSPINSNPPGTRAGDRFTQSLMDSSGNIGMQWGYARDNEMLWRANASGPWNFTGIYANAAQWDGIKVDIDLTADTFALNYYDVVNNTWTNLAPAGTALGVPMNNFAALRWQLEDGTNGGVGGKNFFDDAKVTVPAPGAAALLGLGALAMGRRRRA